MISTILFVLYKLIFVISDIFPALSTLLNSYKPFSNILDIIGMSSDGITINFSNMD
jgi:hypothetical protein